MIECYRHKAKTQANAVAEVFGKELHVNSEDVMWGLGQVSSHYDVLGFSAKESQLHSQ